MRRERSGRLPAALAARPEIAPWAEPYWRAFLELARERRPGPPPGPILLSSIRAWLAEERIDDPVLRAEYREIVGLLDQAWIAHATTDPEGEMP